MTPPVSPDQPGSDASADTAPVLSGTDVTADPDDLDTDTDEVPATSDPEQLTDDADLGGAGGQGGAG